MAVVSSHDRADYFVVENSDKKQLITNRKFLIDHEAWSIVGGFVGENCFPQRDNLVAMRSVIVIHDRNTHLDETILIARENKMIRIGFRRDKTPNLL
jgi:hypothetical protein